MDEGILWSIASFIDPTTGRVFADMQECVLGIEWSGPGTYEQSAEALRSMPVGTVCGCGEAIIMEVLGTEPSDDLNPYSAWVYVDVTPIRKHRCSDGATGTVDG